jgi:hypothetical protein
VVVAQVTTQQITQTHAAQMALIQYFPQLRQTAVVVVEHIPVILLDSQVVLAVAVEEMPLVEVEQVVKVMLVVVELLHLPQAAVAVELIVLALTLPQQSQEQVAMV